MPGGGAFDALVNERQCVDHPHTRQQRRDADSNDGWARLGSAQPRSRIGPPFVGAVLSRYGQIDVFVNNAATAYSGPAEGETLEQLCYPLDTNTVGLGYIATGWHTQMRRRVNPARPNVPWIWSGWSFGWLPAVSLQPLHELLPQRVDLGGNLGRRVVCVARTVAEVGAAFV